MISVKVVLSLMAILLSIMSLCSTVLRNSNPIITYVLISIFCAVLLIGSLVIVHIMI